MQNVHDSRSRQKKSCRDVVACRRSGSKAHRVLEAVQQRLLNETALPQDAASLS